MTAWIVDGSVGFLILWLAWSALSTADLLRAVAMFVTFGLVVAIAWIRLQAPDLALAEAAIGAGLTGALLLITIRRINDRRAASGSKACDGQVD